MSVPQLFPKPPRQMKQPRKDSIRFWWAVALAELAYARTPRWWRWWHRAYARVVETDPETAAAMPSMENLTDGT